MLSDMLSLYLVTDPVLCGKRGVPETCRQALQAGVKIIQLRDKTASNRDLLETAIELKELCSLYNALFIINDNVTVAISSNADGVHLGQDDMSCKEAREMLGRTAIIGISVRTPEEAVEAWEDGADYIAANMIFQTDTKTDIAGPPLGLESIAELKKATPLPLIAIGGINASNANIVRNSGADGIAVVSAIMAADDVPSAVYSLGGHPRGHPSPGV